MTANLLEVRPVTGRDTLYRLSCPELAAKARPGQFVEVLLSDGPEPFLRRPISIFDCDGSREFSLLVRTVGRGTRRMTGWTAGREVDVLGPLGRGFFWEDADRVCTLVGGGIGVAPLGFLAGRLLAEGRQVRLVFTPERDRGLLEHFPGAERVQVSLCRDRSELPGVLAAALEGADRCFACGPEGMLESVAGCAGDLAVPCQLSMERRMACGFGICLGCAIAVRTPAGLTYRKVCKDGPVFRAEEVAFHELP